MGVRRRLLQKHAVLELLHKQTVDLRVREQLAGYSIAAKNIQESPERGSFHLIVLNLDSRSLRISSYGKDRLRQANEDYAAAERAIAEGQEIQAVLVSTESMENLRRAFPNYFLDTTAFVAELDEVAKAMNWYEGMEEAGWKRTDH